MSEQKINPELMLKAANIAYPNLDFAISGNDVRQRIPHSPYFGRCFNPLTSDDDAWKLETALIDKGWSLKRGPAFGAKYIADLGEGDSYLFAACDDRHRLLLKCVSAMTGIPLYRDSAILSKE